MYRVRHRVVVFCAYACLVGMLTGPVHAQVKGRGTDPGAKTPEASAASRQEGVTVNAKSAALLEGASGQLLASHNKDEKIPPASLEFLLRFVALINARTDDPDGRLAVSHIP